MFKSSLQSTMLVALGVAIAWALPRGIGPRWQQHGAVRSAPTIEQVRELSALVTVSVDVADVQVSDVRGWTGGVRVALLVRGQYLLGTDLGAGRFESVDRGARAAVLVLPPPTATHPRLDHDRAKLYAVSPYGLWELVPSARAEVAAANAALLAAQDSLAAAAGGREAVERARRQAEAVLTCFFRAIEWEVTVRWSDRP